MCKNKTLRCKNGLGWEDSLFLTIELFPPQSVFETHRKSLWRTLLIRNHKNVKFLLAFSKVLEKKDNFVNKYSIFVAL